MFIFDINNNTDNIIFEFNIDKKIEDTLDLNFDKLNSTLIVNNSLLLNLNSNIIVVSDFYRNYFNLNDENILNITFYNLEIDLNPPIIIPYANFILTFNITDFPFYLNVSYKEDGSIILHTFNITGL